MKKICFIPPLQDKTVKKIKTQTRRIMSVQPDDSGLHNHTLYPLSVDSHMTGFWGTVAETGEHKEFKPRYKVGEIVAIAQPYKDIIETLLEPNGMIRAWIPESIGYRNKLYVKPILMPHQIKITGVRAERLQDISGYDCVREGIEYKFPKATSMTQARIDYKSAEPQLKKAYAELIDSINGKGTWESNPYVWVYDYELVDRKEAEL